MWLAACVAYWLLLWRNTFAIYAYFAVRAVSCIFTLCIDGFLYTFAGNADEAIITIFINHTAWVGFFTKPGIQQELTAKGQERAEQSSRERCLWATRIANVYE